MLACRTILLGYHYFICPTCKHSLKVPHSCKSRFCSSCSKKSTDKWIKEKFETLPDTTWQHITFTMPSDFWAFFWTNRHLMNDIPPIAAGLIMNLAKEKGYLPGLYLAIHTFGRDLKRNYHLHLSTTIGGLDIKTKKTWVSGAYIHHQTLKNKWKYEIISLFRNEYKAGRLKLPPQLKHLNNYTTFNSWLNVHYQKTWVVHLNKQTDNLKHNVEYLGKYLKRPPIGETRIKKYDHKKVTYEYLDHYTKENKLMSLPVLDFIERLITHIPDKHFRNIRYYGFLANRNVGKYLPIVNTLIKKTKYDTSHIATTWRDMIKQTFGRDPLQCMRCGAQMLFSHIIHPSFTPVINRHKDLAYGRILII